MADTIPSEALIWRTGGGDNSRRGLFGRSVQVNFQPVRRLAAAGAVQASVVFDAEGTAYVADMAGGVQAFSSDGTRKWRVKLTGGISATPVVHPKEPRLFVGSHAGWVCALDTATGATRWRRELPTKSDPRILSDLLLLVEADVVVLSGWGGSFHALEAATGEERFSWDAGISPTAAAAADGRGNLFCLRAVAGKGIEFVRVTAKGEAAVLHHQPEDARGARRALVAAAPVVDEARGRVYFITNENKAALLHAWSLQSERRLWSRRLAHAVQATPTVLHNGGVVVADLAGFVQGLDAEGEVVWRYASGSEYLLAGGVAEAEGAFFIGDPLGMLHVIDVRGVGKPVFEGSRAIQARPAFDTEGRLYLPSTSHEVFVFSPVAGRAKAVLPTQDERPG